MRPIKPIRLAIFDFDNTLWDYNTVYDASLEALIDGIARQSQLPREQIIEGFKAVGRKYRVLEDRDFLKEHPLLNDLFPGAALEALFTEAYTEYRKIRDGSLNLFEGVHDTLVELKRQQVRLVCFSESNALNVAERLKNIGLDGVFDVLYTPPARFHAEDWDESAVEAAHVFHGLEDTVHKIVTLPFPKNNHLALEMILREEDVAKEEAVMVGDSIVRDILMAQSAGVDGIYAKYGHVDAGQHMLATSPWTEAMVAAYRRLSKEKIEPYAVAHHPSDLLRYVQGPQMTLTRAFMDKEAS